jgi:uncharacterized protein (TIGR03437 family)
LTLSCFVLCSYAGGQSGIFSAPAQKVQVVEGYGKLPLSFEANAGQADRQVKFLSRGDGYGLYLTGREAVLALHKGGCAGAATSSVRTPGHRLRDAACKQNDDVVRMRLAGAGGRKAPAGEAPLPGKVNYFIGSDPASWHTAVPTYAKVRYRSIYPGVDLVYYGSHRQLEYDFLVAPGADPKPIRLQFAGAKGLRLGADGDLVVTASNGALAFHKPLVYQMIDGQRKAVEGGFAMLDKRTVGFRLGIYDRAKPLVIDPVLAYSTYLGGSGINTQPGFGDIALGLAVDGSGSAYIAGYTFSSDFPTTKGALQATNPACTNCEAAFVSKLNPSGTALVYSTYLAASGGVSAANAISVDGFGNAYVVGAANSGFPVTAGAFQAVDRAGTGFNAFVTKLSPPGDALIYSTYLGGTETSYEGGDDATAVEVDNAGNAYVAGVSYSSDFPVTAGAFQTVNKAGLASNAFLSKLNPAGSALVYSTYLGGSGRILFSFGPQQWDGDGATALAVDSAGNAYVTGYAYSADFPVTAGAFQTTNPAVVPYSPGGIAASYNQANAFVTKLNPTGTALVYSTYLGGSGHLYHGDSASGLAVDDSGNAYITGQAWSTDFPTTHGVFQKANHSQTGSNAFVAELNSAGNGLVYSTYLGGSGSDVGAGLALDGSGNAYVAGSTESTDFPITQGALQTTNNSLAGGSAFLTELDPAGSALVYSTYLGGRGASKSGSQFGDSANAVTVDNSGNAYIAGAAYSTNFPVTKGAFQAANHSTSGAPSAFVAKLGLNAPPPAPAITPGGIVPVDSAAGAIQPGEWASIYGTNLASVVTAQTGGFPQSLGGARVTIDGKPAYLSYVSPGQINLQVPDDTNTGTVSVVVTTESGSASADVTLADVAPSFLLFDAKHVAGVILRQDGTGAYGQGKDSYDILGPTGTSLGFPTVAAKAGDIVELFGTGFGPTNPAVPSGQAFSGAAPTTYTVSLQINNTGVGTMWAGLSAAGLGQINLTIPSGLGTGDVPLVAGISGGHTPLYVTPSYVVISLQ